MKFTKVFVLFLFVVSLLSGCMYPEEDLSKNQIAYEDQVESVQKAVNQFKEDNGGILPIKNKDANTPLYQKYPIDFARIVPRYIPEPPGNAFENGGLFQYVIVEAETNPTVKLIDLRIAEKIRDLKIRLQTQQYPPFKKQISENVFTLDYKVLGYKEEPFVVSPYSNRNLSFIIDGQGEIFVDYSSDLYTELKNTKRQLKPGEDIRSLLVEKSMFVPAFSLPYTYDKETKEPVFLSK